MRRRHKRSSDGSGSGCLLLVLALFIAASWGWRGWILFAVVFILVTVWQSNRKQPQELTGSERMTVQPSSKYPSLPPVLDRKKKPRSERMTAQPSSKYPSLPPVLDRKKKPTTENIPALSLEELEGIERDIEERSRQLRDPALGIDRPTKRLLLREVLLPSVLNTLTPRERRVLILRFGLEDGRSRTLEEVGKEFGITRESIRQIEGKALRKLRHPTRSRYLVEFLDLEDG